MKIQVLYATGVLFYYCEKMKKILIFFAVVLFPALFFAQNDCKCCADENRQFDFWIGHWNVYNPDGELIGINKIEKIQAGCVLQESWESNKSNFTGTSYNYYNEKTRLWEQLWLDNKGGVLKLSGNRQGNEMVLSSKPDKNNVSSVINRITWTLNRDGTVRQHWETSKDSLDWKTVFDGLYKKQSD